MADTISNYKPSLLEALQQTGQNLMAGGQPNAPGVGLLQTPAPTAPLHDYLAGSGFLGETLAKAIPSDLGDVTGMVGAAIPVVGALAGSKTAREQAAALTTPSKPRAGRIPYGYKKGMPREDYLAAVEKQKWVDAADDVLGAMGGHPGEVPTSTAGSLLRGLVPSGVASALGLGEQMPAQIGQDIADWRKKRSNAEIEAALAKQ